RGADVGGAGGGPRGAARGRGPGWGGGGGGAGPPRLPSQNPACAPIRAPATAASNTGPSDRCTGVAALAVQHSPAVNSNESPGRKNPASRPVSANTTRNTPNTPRPASQNDADKGPAASTLARTGGAAPCKTCIVALSHVRATGWPRDAVTRPGYDAARRRRLLPGSRETSTPSVEDMFYSFCRTLRGRMPRRTPGASPPPGCHRHAAPRSGATPHVKGRA